MPLEIAQAEYANIKTAIPIKGLFFNLRNKKHIKIFIIIKENCYFLIKEFEFLNSWYYLDDNSIPPCYRLKPLIKSFPNIYNRFSAFIFI